MVLPTIIPSSMLGLRFILFSISILLLSATNLQAQANGYVVARSAGNVGGSPAIEVKWFTEYVQNLSTAFLYRQQEGQSTWELITPNGIKALPTLPSDYSAEPHSEYLEQLALEQRKGKLSTMALLPLWIKSFESNAFSRFLGIYYQDQSLVLNQRYRYKVIQKAALSDKEIGITDWLQASAEVSITGPVQEVVLEAGKKSVSFYWKEEPLRFWAVNVWRKQRGQSDFIKVNTNPLMTADTDSSGKSERKLMFEDNGLSENIFYEYKIVGLGFFGEETAIGGTYPIYIKDRNAPERPTLQLDSVNKLNVTLFWRPTNVSDHSGYYLFRGTNTNGPFEKLNEIPLKETQFKDQVTRPNDYYYFLVSQDTAGNEAVSEKIIVNVEDIFPPAIPSGLKVVADTGYFALTWKANTEADLWGYYVFRALDSVNVKNMVPLNANPITGLSFQDTLNRVARNRFYYRIVAVDSSYNRSEYSSFSAATLPNSYPPAQPHIRRITIDTIQKELIVHWTANVETDLSHYLIEFSLLGAAFQEAIKVNKDSTTCRLSLTLFPASGEYLFRMSAIDVANNASPYSEVYGYYLNQAVEAVPLKVTYKWKEKTRRLDLTWDKDKLQAIKGYVVWGWTDGQEPVPLSGMLTEPKFSVTLKELPPLNIKVTAYYQNQAPVDSTLIALQAKK